MDRPYSRKNIGALLGMRDRTVWYYTEQGLVSPEIANPKGKGTTRLYSAKNVMEIAVARKLAEHGLRLDLIRDLMKSVRLLASRDGFDPWNPSQETPPEGRRFFWLIYDPAGERPRVVSTGLRPGQELKLTSEFGAGGDEFEICIVLDLTAIREKVRAVMA